MGAAKKKCASCGDLFLGRADAVFCSGTCRQRAHRGRGTRKRHTNRDVSRLPAEHSAEAMALLAELDAELAENSAAHGLLEPLVFSAAERAVRESIARNIDRTVDLWAWYQANDDDKARARLSAELRLLENSLKGLLRAVNTDLPAPKSARATHAAEARWRRGPG